MTRKIKIGLYYIIMFFLMCTLIYLVELKTDNDVKKSYEGTSYEGYDKYVSVPKNLEVLGRGEETTFIRTVCDTITDQLLMVLFLIISTIPLVIYYSAKYIEKLDNETNELIDISNNEYLENTEKNKETISHSHRALFDDGYLSSTDGVFCGMLSDHLRMKDVFVSLKEEKNNAIIFENDFRNENYFSKILKGFSYKGEGIVVIDQNDIMYNNTKELMNSFGYDIKRIDFTDNNKQKQKFTKQRKQYKLDLLKYFTGDSEVISLANIISQGKAYLTKMIAALIFVTINDNDNENINPTMRDVYNLSCESLEKVVMRINLYKSSYNIFNELILLDDKTKRLLLEEARDNLELFSDDMFDTNNIDERRDEVIDLEELKNKSIIYYINLDELKAPYALCNAVMEAVYNVCKNSYIKEDRHNNNRKTYLINLSLNTYSKYGHLYDKLKDASKYGLFYLIGLTNVKQFKDKYEYDFDKIIENIDIKIFYAIRQYETTNTLKDELASHGTNDIANIISSLDTNKCIVVSKNYDYSVFNIEEPNGEKYDKYSYGEKENENVISKLKNKDIKLRVNYLDEFKERIAKNKEEEKHKKVDEEKIDIKPELTKEEKEYIANLLKEKQEADSKRALIASYDSYEEDDELADGDVDNVPNNMVRNLTKLYDGNMNNELDDNSYEYDEYDNMLSNGYDSSREIIDDRDKEEAAIRIKEMLSKQNSYRSREEIEASLEKLNMVQRNMDKIIEEEKVKTTHALYEQMKNLK